MSPSPRAAVLLALVAVAAVVLPAALAVALAVALVSATAVDALAARRAPGVRRDVPRVLSRGVRAPLTVAVRPAGGTRVRVRQTTVPDIAVSPQEGDGGLRAEVLARRRGRHALPAPSTRASGPLGLGRWDHRRGPDGELLVFPDLPAARRLAMAVRQGRFRDPGVRTRGPLGLGTDFESVRDYLPDDDVRQVNWRATERLGRPMSNQYRVERDRDVLCLLDAGRLMATPVAGRTRLDAALDAVTAVALVCDELGDRCGALAYDDRVVRRVVPMRRGGAEVVRALFDLEPSARDSDAELAFRSVGAARRAFVLVLCDLLDEHAARSLTAAIPVLARRHAVCVASVADPDLEALVRTEPRRETDVYAAAAALDLLAARDRAAALVRRAGAQTVLAGPDELGAACVRAYLTAKAQARA